MSTADQTHRPPANPSTNDEVGSDHTNDVAADGTVAPNDDPKISLPDENGASDGRSENHTREIAPAASEKVTRKIRTPAEKAYDDALKGKEKAARAVQVALKRLEAEKRESKYRAGLKVMHALLLHAPQSLREGALTVLVGMAADDAQVVLQEYLDALDSAPSEPEEKPRPAAT